MTADVLMATFWHTLFYAGLVTFDVLLFFVVGLVVRTSK